MKATDGYIPELDLVVALTEVAWQKHVKGTWASSDKRIFALGFREGWLERGRQIRKAMKQVDNQD